MNNLHIRKIIDKIKFSIFSPELIRKMSGAKVTVPDTYDDDGYPIDGGLVDMRLGVVDPGLRCKTCGGRATECPGHFGSIELVRPIIHVEFAKHIYAVLKSVCPSCKNLTTGKGVPVPVEVKPAESVAEEVPKEGEQAVEVAEAKPVKKKKKVGKKKCAFCNEELPEIKFLKPTTFYKNKEELLPSEVRDLLTGISDENIKALGFDPVYSRPEWMVLSVLPVPPVNVRPSITLETGERSEDDLTHKLVDIIRINQKLEANINAGAPQLIIEDLWELLQYHVTTFFDNETANIPPARHRSGRPLKTLAQRLKGKEGRFRYNLSGKRVNFSARTVISPDPMISIGEVGVPQEIAEELTIRVSMNTYNTEYCKQMVLSEKYPKALYVIRPDLKRLKITDLTRTEAAENLKVGSVIERQLVNGDIVIFNRQPSLHRISMMAHEVRVLPGKTFRLNPTVTAPYNADFDGDEMNLHVPQTAEAQAEAKLLMKVEDQILSPRHGHAIIRPQEDYVSGLFFLTQEAAEFTHHEAAKILYTAGITELPKPDRKKNYSGRLIFSQILPPKLNLKFKSKLGEDIVIKDSKLMDGTIESKAIENELLEHIFMLYGAAECRKFLDSVTKVALEVITKQGLSVSIRNYTLSEKAETKLNDTSDRMNREIENLILKYKNKTLERAPGMGLKETLEMNIMGLTSRTREEIGKIVESDLSMANTSIIMAKIGARGSLLNAIQMSACVGQQAVRSKRPKRGYARRNLPFNLPGMLSARECGYVFSSFRTGLAADEFYLHSMGGRESLVNTAIRTGRSGYMQRRLINAFQDLVVWPDKTVKDANGTVVQFIYGGDANDPMLASKSEYSDVSKQDDIDTA
ncbi:DNA-directed RNA polymerase subunit A' [Candidatus Micrarchaeota archaeon]|nr:DNA-directed RNA polymerase subunit A' [Candidatus Micrarchaeota archaeon]